VKRRLYLARHGETDWNAIGRLQGHTDVPLNERGRAQARQLAVSLADAGLAAVFASDLSRASETAAIVARELGLPAPRIVPGLRERRFGVFEGLDRAQCMARYPDAWRAWHAQTGVPEGAEPLAEATARMHAVLAELAVDDAGPALVVSHGGVMRLWLVDVLAPAAPPPLHNGVTFVVDHDGDRFVVAPR
jgi:broad specificity phosphatase PhoE